jgi:hypothetical protein
MKYFLSLLTTVLLINSNLHAQTQPGYKLEFGVNTGKTTANPSIGLLGFDIRLEKSFTDRLSGTLTAGYQHKFDYGPPIQKDGYEYLPPPRDVIPVKAGLKFFVQDEIYLGGEAGIGFAHGNNSFLYSPSVGYAFKNGLDMSVKYESYSKNTTASNLSIRLAYGIKLDESVARKQTSQTDSWQLGVGLTAGTTRGGKAVLGSEVELYRPLTGNLEATASLGVFHVFDNHSSYYLFLNKRSEQTFIPAMAGLRLLAGNTFYVAGEAGAAFGTHGKAQFAWSPSAGLAFGSGLDLSLKYAGFDGTKIPGFTSLKIAYHFKL